MEPWLIVAEIIYKLCLPLGGGIGLYLAYLRVTAANRQAEAQIRQAESATRLAELGRYKQATDIFTLAVGQLRDDRLEVRLAAIYTLRKLVDEFPEDRGMVVALLAEHLRDNPRRWGDAETPPADVREIMKLLTFSTPDNEQ
jgi:hypothetical protein